MKTFRRWRRRRGELPVLRPDNFFKFFSRSVLSVAAVSMQRDVRQSLISSSN